jgi:hypothetical protein
MTGQTDNPGALQNCLKFLTNIVNSYPSYGICYKNMLEDIGPV